MTTITTDRRRGINAGAAIKVSCICATTANITLSGEQTIDGITTSGTRLLVKNQTDATENGIYLSGASAWTREPDFDGTYDITEGTLIPVSRGTVNAATFWRVTNTGDITIGTTSITVTAQSLAANAILSDGSVTYAADFLPAITATYDLGSKTVKWEDIVQAGDLVQLEQADHSVTPGAAYGQFWTRSDAPNVAMFTDDDGVDWVISKQLMAEKADHPTTPSAGFGELWVKNDTPNALYFTDDAGTDFNVSDPAYVIAARIYKTSNQTIADNTYVACTFDTVVFQNVTVWSVSNPSRITVPTGYTKIRLQAYVLWEAAADYLQTAVQMYKNGGLPTGASINARSWNVTFSEGIVATRNSQNLVDTGWLDTVATDYYEFLGMQDNSTNDTRYMFGASTGCCWVSVELAR